MGDRDVTARVNGLGYLTLGVSDLEVAIDFYARVARLEISERRPGLVFMSGGREHHWLRLEETGEVGMKRVSYEATSGEALDAIREDLERRGISACEGGDFEADRLRRWLRFVDPGGIEVEVFVGMAQRAVPVQPNGVVLRALLHTLWMVPAFDETARFYQDVLGFKVSDAIEDSAVFMRCGNRYHHSIAFMRGGGSAPIFNHLCLLVDSIDDVMRCRNNALDLGLSLEYDLLRHAPSGSIGVYVQEPMHGFSIEFCCEHEQVDDETHVARNLTFGASTIDVWRETMPAPRVQTKIPFYEALNP